MRVTTPGAPFLATVAPILAAAGPLPHARLDTGGETTRPKKQATLAQMRVQGVRTARKWRETISAPLCPTAGHGAMRHELLDDDEGDPEP